MGKIDPNEAPEGYVAVACDGCYGCEFFHSRPECLGAACSPGRRNDGCYVIFINKPDDCKATASWPYYSEGTPVEVPHA